MPVTTPTIEQVIAAIESGNNMFSMRFEVQTYYGSNPKQTGMPLLLKIGQANHCNIQTAKMIAATSWGKFQIMGFELYAAPLSFNYSVGAFMANSEMQNNVFNSYLLINGINFTVDDLRVDADKRAKFAERYNGPGNVANYSAKILATIIKMTISVPDQFA
jgi:hypothetical protein